MRSAIAVGCASAVLCIACAGNDQRGKVPAATSDTASNATPVAATSGEQRKKKPIVIDSATQLGDTTTKPPSPNATPPVDGGAFVVTPQPNTPAGQPSGGNGNQPSVSGVTDTASRGAPRGPGTSDTASRPRGTQPGVSDTGSARVLRRPLKRAPSEMMMKTQPGAAAARKSAVRDTLIARRRP
jgi:hypothetical protein